MKNLKYEISLNELRNFKPFINEDGIFISGNYDPCCGVKDIDIAINGIFNNNPDYLTLVPSIDLCIFLEHDYESEKYYCSLPYIKQVLINPEFIDLCQRHVGIDIINFQNNTFTIIGMTESKLDFVQSYIESNKYNANLNLADNPNSFTGVLSVNDNSTKYVVNGSANNYNYIQGTGIIYKTFDTFRKIVIAQGCETIELESNTTMFSVIQSQYEGFEIKALIPKTDLHQEVYVVNDIFIDRDIRSPLERHQRFEEIATFEQLENYNNKSYYKLFIV